MELIKYLLTCVITTVLLQTFFVNPLNANLLKLSNTLKQFGNFKWLELDSNPQSRSS